MINTRLFSTETYIWTNTLNPIQIKYPGGHIGASLRDVTIYVYEKNVFNKTVRNEWSINKLVQSINSGKYVLNFLYKYVDGYSSIVECVLESQQKPYISIECTMKLYEIDTYYYWNKIIEDRVW